jgi:hypothetical protein
MARILRRPKHRAATQLIRNLPAGARLTWRFLTKRAEIQQAFWYTIIDCAVHNPRALFSVFWMTALYLDLDALAKCAKEHAQREISLIDCGEWAEEARSFR